MANIYGIDVSDHNGTLDWAKIEASGIKFAIIRSGYGKSYTDKQFHANMQGALAQGLPVGVYHFSYALNVEGAKREAAYVLSLLEPYKDKITLPVFFDFEYDTVDYAKKQGVTLGKQAFNDHTVAFCEAVKAAGYTPGVYYNLDYKNRFVDADRLGGYVQWYAQYNSTASWTGYDLWQYSSSHTISGHSCKFDINVAPESLIGIKPTVRTGWLYDKGWYYNDADGNRITKQIMEGAGQYAGNLYYLGEDGYIVTNRIITVDSVKYHANTNGVLSPIKDVEGIEEVVKPGAEEPEKEEAMETEKRYYKLGEVTSKTYRATLDDLIAKGIVQGKGGEGDELILDLGEDAIRVLVYLDRAGVFG